VCIKGPPAGRKGPGRGRVASVWVELLRDVASLNFGRFSNFLFLNYLKFYEEHLLF